MGNAIMTTQNSDMDGRTLLHRFRYHMGSGFVTPTDTAMDMGCGTGYGSAILASKAKKVYSFDMDQANIDSCHKHHDDIKNIEFAVANLEEAELPKVDVACSFEVIEHLYDPQAFITKAKASVKKFIAVSVPIGETLHEVEGQLEVIGDWSHHSVYAHSSVLDAMFLDDNWARFYGVQSGVTYIAVYYNKKGME